LPSVRRRCHPLARKIVGLSRSEFWYLRTRKISLLVPLLLLAGASASAQSAFKGFYVAAGVGMDTFLPTADNVTLKVKTDRLQEHILKRLPIPARST
jgi:hypothetical protein